MKSSLLFLCGLVCLAQGLGARKPPHNVQRRSTNSTEDITVRLQLEVDAPDPWNLSIGDTVQIRCSVSSDSDMERAKHLKLHLSQVEEESAIQLLATEPATKGISYALGPITLRHRGLYNCEALDLPHTTVENAHKLIWVNDAMFSSAFVRLNLLRVNRVKYFYDKTFTIGCRLYHDKSKWRIFRASEKPGRMVYEECPNQEQIGDIVSCTIPSLSNSRTYDPYWCETSSGRKSNVLNVTESEIRERNNRDFIMFKFDLTPAWFVREGDSVTFLCKIGGRNKNNNSDRFDLQLIWTQMNPENNMTVLVSQRASTPINHTLTNIKHSHSGAYSCWDDGTFSKVDTLAFHHFIWVHDDSPPITIDILSHNRTQFFRNEEMTVGCQLPNDQSQWKLKRFDNWSGTIKECEKSEMSTSRVLSCTTTMEYPWTDYLFWCETTAGLKSNVLNVTRTARWKVMEAPSLPVMEGNDITLRCLQKDETTGNISVVPAFFQFNGITFEWSDAGIYTIKNVTKAMEGFFSCKDSNDDASLKTFVTIKERLQEE